jgi:hypothetical protein
MPLFAAAVGVLGRVGGALVGGFIANQGQEEGFRRERAAAKQDLRMEAYADFLGTAQGLVTRILVEGDEAKAEEWLVKLWVSQARVLLVFENPEVAEAATRLGDEVARGPTEQEIETCGRENLECLSAENLNTYEAAASEFLAPAREEIAETAE